MSRTHSVPRNTMSMAFEQIPNDDLNAVIVPETKPIPLTVSLTELLTDPTHTVRSTLINSFLASLNLQLVTRLREHLRMTKRTRDDSSDKPSVDQRAEADDELGQNGACYDQGNIEEASAAYAGNRTPMTPLEVAKRLAMIRAFCHHQQQMMRTSTAVPFEPRSLHESIDFLRSQLPLSSNPTDPAILVAMEVTGMSADICVRMRNQGFATELAQLLQEAPEVVALGEALTSNYLPDAQAVEEAFDSLPAHVKYNVYAAGINACTSVFNSAFKKVLMRGNAAAAGDLPIAKALHKRGMHTLSLIEQKHSRELNEHMDRGGSLKEVKLLS